MRLGESMAACQIAFAPIGTPDYLEGIRQVLRIIKDSGLEYDIGDLSTVVKGEHRKVLELIETIYLSMKDCGAFIMDIRLSNRCGCEP